MTQIRAFVGHSFSEEDEPVVSKFLEYFDVIQNLDLGFTWDHAKAAETKEVAEKVLNKIQNKELFIGICTSKEKAINSNELRRDIFGKRLSGNVNSYLSKTSDWIIQEVGLAIGRNMDLMLLIEQGVRNPGGLQGNHEYISFDRAAPGESFKKILETILSLIPNPVGKQFELVNPNAETEHKKTEEEEPRENLVEPQADWSRRKYRIALILQINDGNHEGVQKIYEAFLATEEGKNDTNRKNWEAFREFLLITHGKTGSIASLEKMAKRSTENSQIKQYVAQAYNHYQDYEKAAQYFMEAAEKADDEDKLARLGDATIAFFQAGNSALFNSCLGKMKSLTLQVKNGEVLLIKTLCKKAELAEDTDQIVSLKEKLLDLKPDDSDTRFSLAYKYSQAGHENLSLFHYLRIKPQEREGASWNNLGVQCDHFGLVNKSVNAYRKAEELKETLAMSNLAQKYIEAGFMDEAEEICNEAFQIKNYHKNVAHAIARIKSVPDEEDKKEKKIIEETKPSQSYYKKFGHGLTRKELHDMKGLWVNKECDLDLEISAGCLLAMGSYEKENSANAWVTALQLGTTDKMMSPPKMVKYNVRYEAVFTGYSAKGTVTIEEVGASKHIQEPGLLGGVSNARKILLVMSEDLKNLDIYERSGKEETFLSLKRKSSD